MIFTRLEIDVMQANELVDASELAAKHKFPALVVHQDLASEAQIIRGRIRGRYKLITPIDWPKGETYGQNKLRGLSTDALDNDGFEILLTGERTVTETRREAKDISEFVKTHIDQSLEVRFVLGTNLRTEENIRNMCIALQDVRMPAFVRNDTALKLQVSRANPDVHKANMGIITEYMRVPMKISGNINSVRAITSCTNAKRFAVNLLQAKGITKEFLQQPEELRALLDSEDGK